MVVQNKDNKAPSSLLELLGGSSKSNKSKTDDTFAKLLSTLDGAKKGVKSLVKKADFTAIIDPKKDSASSVDTSSKVKSADIKPIDTKKLNAKALGELLLGKDDEAKALPKELIDVLSNDQVHSLISKAKVYLKHAIMQKSPELTADDKTIPKTLIGLVELAHKIGIDLSEITLSTVDKDLASPLKELPTPLLTKPLLEFKVPSKEIPAEPTKGFEAIVQLLNESKTSQSDTKPVKESKKTSEQPLQSLLQGLEKGPELIQVLPKEAPKTAIPVPHLDALSALLRDGDNTEIRSNKEEIKTHTESAKSHQPLKADSLEVKGKEAVQSMRHFAIDLKEAAENYKPPFTRLTMKLNPQRLGEVDVTLIQRGNNVHVTIQSNNTASVAFLAHNATELKAQLAQQGVTNATMNFMSHSDGQPQNPQQQQQQQNQNRFRAYTSLEELHNNNQELSALEIILPRYA